MTVLQVLCSHMQVVKCGLYVDAIWCAWASVSLGWCLGGMGGWGAFSLNIYQVLSGFVVSVSGGRETGIEVRTL